MSTTLARISSHVRMTERVFHKLGNFIEQRFGIKMPSIKRIMLESRLQKRLRTLGLNSFDEYIRYVFCKKKGHEELVNMVNIATTNKTDFFREPKHFEFLAGTALPGIQDLYGSGLRRPFRIWSAGCSTGEEPYTIAMVLSEHARKVQGFKFRILATDLSTEVLEHGRNAIYGESLLEPVSHELRRKYVLKSRDRDRRLVRMSPGLRGSVTFRHLNFMDADYGINEKMDIIFCRNVIIYFENQTKQTIIRRLMEHLIPGGYIFLGHSESLIGLDVPMETVSHTVYRKPL
ncbi:hypothetical protein LCGC14_1173540 [marine sediment metagenome]|uniref:protein-glutamate O-methyltransferase n=1 Tax=marine sediment metagenome TaxID=412755 RepID=A0A0F9LPB5_9ZZZZ